MGLLSSLGKIVSSVVPFGGLIANVGSTLLSSNASKNAAQTQADAAAQAGQQEWAIYNQNRADMQPWMQTGQQALGRLSDLAGISGNTGVEGYGSLLTPFSGQNLQDDPGYQFRMSEGLKALDRSASAKGKLFSGAAGKALTEYGQGVGAQEYQNAYDRYRNNQSDIFNRLSGLAGTGQTTASNLGTQGMNLAGSLSDLTTGAANAQAAGQVGQANAWNSGLKSLGSSLASLSQPKIYWNN